MKRFKARQTYLLFILILSVFLITGCGNWSGGGEGEGVSAAQVQTPAPTVTFTDPVTVVAPGVPTSGVAINKKISATFSEAMDPLTITTTTFTLKQGATAVSGTVTYSGVTAVFTPTDNLAYNTTYTATITTGAKDLAGNALAANYTWSFTTGAAPDTTAPTVTFTDPANTATGVAINRKISATFSEGMDPLTVTTANFTVTGPDGTPVTGTVILGATTYIATFTPTSNLAYNTTYTATITTGAKDLAGNALAANYTWSFTTGAAPDTTPPTVSSTVPANAATGVSTNTKISATFSEAMDPLMITTTTFTLKQGATAVSGTVTYSGVTAVFTPASNLAASTTYTATITTGAKDLAGNALAANYTWSFTTGVATDTTAPTVTQLTGTATKILATFSEAMDPLTITTTTFTVAGVTGTVTSSGVYATFTPASNLAASTYTVTITTGAKDLAGNALASNYVWSFTITGPATDTTAPTVTLTAPANAATGVCINKAISATFSEAMDPLTITTANFTVAGVTGTVTYDATTNIATFTPASNLAASTTYTATITTGAKDLAGNALASNYVWSFTTGTTTCTTAPSLGTAGTFGAFGGGAGITNQGTLTIINGDIGTTAASTLITGFHDTGGNVYTETPLNIGTVNGTIYTATAPPGSDPGVIAAQALSDAQTAFNNLSPASLPGGIDPGAGQLGGLTLAPGIYQAAGGSFLITGSDLTLDAGGDANAAFVFQMASTLTVGAPGAPRSIILINGAQAKNVFWQVGSAATINAAGGGTMVGTIIAYSGVTFSTAGNVTVVTLEGRALGLNASVTMVNTVINVPAQ